MYAFYRVLAGTCKHLPPYGEAMSLANFKWYEKGRTYNLAAEKGTHFVKTTPCLGNGKACTSSRLVHCMYCPMTKFEQLKGSKGGDFCSWTNPLVCRTNYDVVRACCTHYESAWHQFWYAVATLSHQLPAGGGEIQGAAGAAGGAQSGGPAHAQDSNDEHTKQCIKWIQEQAGVYVENRGKFFKADLLLEGLDQIGSEWGIPDKFRRADALLEKYRLKSLPKKSNCGKRKKAIAESNKSDELRYLALNKKLKLVVAQVAGLENKMETIIISMAQDSASRIARDDLSSNVSGLPLPQVDSVTSMAHLAGHNILPDANGVSLSISTVLSDAHAEVLSLASRQHRPINNLILDAMSGVTFDSQVPSYIYCDVASEKSNLVC